MFPDIFGENPNFGFPTLDPWLGSEGFPQGVPWGVSETPQGTPWGKPSGPSHGSRVGKPKLRFSPKMSGNMFSHRINMVYGGFEGFWRSYGRRQVYTSIWEAILVIRNGHFAPYGQILKIRFSAIKYRILDFLSDSSSGRYPLSIPHLFRGGKKTIKWRIFSITEKRGHQSVYCRGVEFVYW